MHQGVGSALGILLLGMIIEFTYVYRGLDAMKNVYMFLGLVAYIATFLTVSASSSSRDTSG